MMLHIEQIIDHIIQDIDRVLILIVKDMYMNIQFKCY